MAYKRDIDDQRESPSLKIVELLLQHGGIVDYNDPHVPRCSGHRHYPDIDMESQPLNEESLQRADIVLLLTDHSAYDYDFIANHARIIVDTRNAFERRGIKSPKIYKA